MMQTPMKLDVRLQTVASLVRRGVRVADIGTDHGYLLAHLLQQGTAVYGYACDINEKPLEKAAFTLSACKSEHRAETILCDGLSGLRAGDVDDIVIAGMGGELIWDILHTCPWAKDERLRFVLQPMTKPERLRRSLYAGGYEILTEAAAVWRGRAYTVMQAAYTGQPRDIDDALAYCGKLTAQDDRAAQAYIEKVRAQLEKQRFGAQKTGDTAAAARLDSLLDEITGRTQP